MLWKFKMQNLLCRVFRESTVEHNSQISECCLPPTVSDDFLEVCSKSGYQKNQSSTLKILQPWVFYEKLLKKWERIYNMFVSSQLFWVPVSWWQRSIAQPCWFHGCKTAVNLSKSTPYTMLVHHRLARGGERQWEKWKKHFQGTPHLE